MGAVLEIGEEMADIIDPAINSVSRAYSYGRC